VGLGAGFSVTKAAQDGLSVSGKGVAYDVTVSWVNESNFAPELNLFETRPSGLPKTNSFGAGLRYYFGQNTIRPFVATHLHYADAASSQGGNGITGFGAAALAGVVADIGERFFVQLGGRYGTTLSSPSLSWLYTGASLGMRFGEGVKRSNKSKSSKRRRGNTTEASLLTEKIGAGGLIEQQIDLNKDERPDVFNFYRARKETTRLLVRKEVDLNWDGKIDVRTWFTDSGEIEKEEMDGDFDSRVDWIDHYKGGRRVMSEIDSDYDGAMDLFKYYENGKLRRKERDSKGDGRIDFWEYLDEQGNVLRTGRDVDGDGVMDIRDE